MSDAQPRCPQCDVTGMEHIVSKESRERSRNRQPWFMVVHCNACGHVYNVIAKHVFSQDAPATFVMPKIR